MVRITVGGESLAGFAVDQPAASVRLLLPSDPPSPDELPRWDRNNFVFSDGRRPVLRTITPLRFDARSLELDLEIVVHGNGPASDWADAAVPGVETAISGPARGYDVDPSASDFLLLGDETAIPAITQLLQAIPDDLPVTTAIAVTDESARIDLPERDGVSVDWLVQAGDAAPASPLASAVTRTTVGDGTRVWAAGEAAAMQAIRRHLIGERAMPRSSAWVRGYWKHGRGGDDEQ
jgi:NADPH-dependent ferric siderophore reductase